MTNSQVCEKPTDHDVHTRQECWPDGVRDACRRIEAECPGWHVWWDGCYCAQPGVGTEVGTLHAADPYTLCGLITHVEVGAP